jgi:hypothetical protein
MPSVRCFRVAKAENVMDYIVTRLVILGLTLCSVVIMASAKQKGTPSGLPSESLIRKAVIRNLGDPREWGYDADAIKFVSARDDLNDDGRPELLVWVPSSGYGGTSGYPLLIFRDDGRRLKLLSKIEPVWSPLFVLESSRRGWRDIVVQMGGGGDPMRYVVHHYNGKTYSDRFREIRAERVRGRQLIGEDWRMTVMGPLPPKE